MRVDGEDDRFVARSESADDLGADERFGVLERERDRGLTVAAAAELERQQRRVAARAGMGGGGTHARDDEVELLDLLRRLHDRRVPVAGVP